MGHGLVFLPKTIGHKKIHIGWARSPSTLVLQSKFLVTAEKKKHCPVLSTLSQLRQMATLPESGSAGCLFLLTGRSFLPSVAHHSVGTPGWVVVNAPVDKDFPSVSDIKSWALLLPPLQFFICLWDWAPHCNWVWHHSAEVQNCYNSSCCMQKGGL